MRPGLGLPRTTVSTGSSSSPFGTPSTYSHPHSHAHAPLSLRSLVSKTNSGLLVRGVLVAGLLMLLALSYTLVQNEGPTSVWLLGTSLAARQGSPAARAGAGAEGKAGPGAGAGAGTAWLPWSPGKRFRPWSTPGLPELPLAEGLLSQAQLQGTGRKAVSFRQGQRQGQGRRQGQGKGQGQEGALVKKL